jgi:hypothetical protein
MTRPSSQPPLPCSANVPSLGLFFLQASLSDCLRKVIRRRGERERKKKEEREKKMNLVATMFASQPVCNANGQRLHFARTNSQLYYNCYLTNWAILTRGQTQEPKLQLLSGV